MKYDEFRKLMKAVTPAREIAVASEPPMEPTIFERGGEWVNENVPVLPAILEKFGEVASIGTKAATAINPISAITGTGPDLGERVDRLLSIPKANLGPLVGIGEREQKDWSDTGLSEMGITPDVQLGRWDSPIGTFTGRGALKFLFSVGTDPLVYTGSGLTAAGRAARSLGGKGVLRPAGGLASAPISEAGRVGSALAAQALEGQRSLLTFMGRSVVPRKVSAAVLGTGEKGLRKAASVFPKMARYSGFGEIKKGGVVGGIEGGMERIKARIGSEHVKAEVERMAAARGVSPDEIWDEVVTEGEQIANNPALRRAKLDLERKASRAQAVHERMVSEATSEAPDVLKSQGGTMPGRARRALDAATRLREEAAGINAPTVREAVGLTPEQAAKRGAGPTLTNLRAEAYRMADEYRAKGFSPKESARAAVQRLRNPDLDPEMAPLAAMWDRVLRPTIREERRRGVMTTTLSDPYLNWVSHSLAPEAVERMMRDDVVANAIEQAWRRKFSARNAAHMKRKAAHEGMRIPEVEAEFRKRYPDFTGDVFLATADPMAMTARRAAQTERSVSTAGLVRHVAEDLSAVIPESGVPSGWIALDDVVADSGHVLHEGFLRQLKLQTSRVSPRGASTPTSLANLKGRMIPNEVAAALVKRISLLKNPATPGAFMNVLLAATDSFKWLTTRIFPEFYVRNFNSDVFRNFESGVVNPLRYVSAGRMLKDARFGDGMKTWTLGGKVYTSKALRDYMEAGGIRFSGAAADTSGASPRNIIRRGAAKIDNAVSAGENLTRATHFMQKLDEGLSVEDAILSVKKFLFDYKDLTPLERHGLRVAVPFYSWLRFNTPLMLESLVARPGKIAVVGHAMRALDDGEGGGMNTTAVPPWVQRRLYFTTKADDGTQTTVSGLGLPFEDLANFDGPPDKFLLNVVSMLNPAIKFPIEKATGIETFRGIPIKNDERANPLLRHLGSIPGGKAFLDWLDFREVREGVYRANPEKIHWMTAPFLAGTSRASATAQRLMQDPAGAWLKLATGLRVNPMSPEEQAVENMRQSVQRVVDRLDSLQGQGITREMEDRFMIRRDVLPTDPRVMEARRLQREATIARKLLGHLSDAQRFAGAQASLRTGGAR